MIKQLKDKKNQLYNSKKSTPKLFEFLESSLILEYAIRYISHKTA